MDSIRHLSKITVIGFLLCILFGFLFLIPNFFKELPVIQSKELDGLILKKLQEKHVFKVIKNQHGDSELLFESINSQLNAFEDLKKIAPQIKANLNLKHDLPIWISSLGLKPMKLGLDLRGGVHFVLSVDYESVVDKQLLSLEEQIKNYHQNLHQKDSLHIQDHVIVMPFDTQDILLSQRNKIAQEFPDYLITHSLDKTALELSVTPTYLAHRRLDIIDTTISCMRNRINELGVAEASIYTQGQNQIVIDLPGIQDVKEAKQLLGKTATIDFYLAHPTPWKPGQLIPFGGMVKKDKGNHQILLQKKAVLSGDAIVFAQAAMNQDGKPSVDLKITGEKSREFKKITGANVGKQMAVVYKEISNFDRWNSKTLQFETVHEESETIISFATIMSQLSDRFQITGLERAQSYELALMLRAGSLPAPVKIIEEKTIGPSLGAENIKMGINALAFGLVLIFSFMAVYYKKLGWIANLTLFSNLLFLIMALALIQATLTLPGIAGIVLTLGMAVDANVLIYERVRDELRDGCDAWQALDRGVEKAGATIFDSNMTTMIIGFVLFFLGSGAIKGFAVTLCIGLFTSMITAIIGTKVFIHLIFCQQDQPIIKFMSCQSIKGITA